MAGRKSRTPKPAWTVGKELPPFSGKNWWELEDVYPRAARIKSDSWRIVGLFGPAWIVFQEKCIEMIGTTLNKRQFEMLCYMQRVEEMRENSAIDSYPVLKGLNISGSLYYAQKAPLQKLGLVERLPIPTMRLYRVTHKGKVLLKSFDDSILAANNNMESWVAAQNEQTRNKINKLLWKYYPGWDPNPSSSDSQEPQ